MAIRYLDWAVKYHVPKEGEPAVEYDHCRRAINFLIKHFRDVPAVKFTALSLEFLQGKLSEHKARNKEAVMRHKHSKTTETFYAPVAFEKAIEIVREIG